MKNILLIFIFCCFYQITDAQYTIAGSTAGIYIDIVPDTIIGNAGNPSFSSYSIDINQDEFNDVIVVYSFWVSFGASMYSIGGEKITASSLNNNLSLCFWKTFCDEQTLLKPFNIGDTINNNNYVNHGDIAYVIDHVDMNGTPSECSNIEWTSGTDYLLVCAMRRILIRLMVG